MPATTIPESHRDLLQTDVAILTTIGADGYPQTTALWFLFDEDGLIRLSLNSSRQKTHNLVARPQVTFFVLDRANPQRYLEIRARAEAVPDPDYAFANKLGAKYGMSDFRRLDRPGETRLVVTLHPVRITAVNMGG